MPVLTDEQNVEINRVYFGNPFKLLLTGNSNSKVSSNGAHLLSGPNGINQAVTEVGGAFDERAFEHAGGQDTPMPGQTHATVTPAQISEALKMKGIIKEKKKSHIAPSPSSTGPSTPL